MRCHWGGSCFVAFVYMLCHVYFMLFLNVFVGLEGDTSRASCEAWCSRFEKVVERLVDGLRMPCKVQP